MHDAAEAKRVEQTNAERQALAHASGWQFRAEGSDLLQRWPGVKPFTEVGDMRAVYGVVYGQVGPVSFTAFDYLRREKVTHTLGVAVNIFVIETVWVLRMPAALPPFQIADSAEPSWSMEGGYAPQTQDGKINRGWLLFGTDPGFATALLNPHVIGAMRAGKINNWAIAGQDLLCSKYPIFGRVKPKELAETAGNLHRMMTAFPPHLWQAGAVAPQQQQAWPQQPPQPSGGYPQQPAPGHQPPPGYPPHPAAPTYPAPQPTYPAQQPTYPAQPQTGYPHQYPPQPPQHPQHPAPHHHQQQQPPQHQPRPLPQPTVHWPPQPGQGR